MNSKTPENEETSAIIKKNFVNIKEYIAGFIKWLLLGILIGIICGAIGCLFHIAIEKATEFRIGNPNILYLLPVAGIPIVFIYQTLKLKEIDGTNYVIDSIRKDGKIPITMAVGIFVSTVLTHLFGGSAGREGAALQLGGSLGSSVGRVFKLNDKDMHVCVFGGMSAVFAALFGTPLTAAIFVIEVVSVGVIYHSALLPCVFSSVTAVFVTKLFGIKHTPYEITGVPDLLPLNVVKTIGLGVLCALVSIMLCAAMKQTHKLLGKYIKNDYLRIVIGGIIIVLISLFFGSDYNGAGMNIAEAAFLTGTAKPYAFIIKIIITAITIGCGFKGGEIVPSFFIGATFGCVAAPFLGLDAGFGAALGLASVFCGVTNTPLASIVLSVELFGAKVLPFFAVVCMTSYFLSGYFSLYKTQIIVYDKLKFEYINRETR